MKKIIILLIVFLIPFNVRAISASSVIVMDSDNKRVLSGYNYHDKRLIASISKIMTAIVAIEYGDLDKKIEVTNIIKKSFGSGIYIKVGEKITLKDLLYGLMLRSGNDAALQIAEHISGNVDEFVYLMNEYASKLNMKNTKFINPHGLENEEGKGNTSTSYDMALLTSYAIKNNVFRKIFSTKEYTCKTNLMTYKWYNKNKLLKYDFITGGKTGFTEKARRTLVTTGSKNNINLVIVTLNDPNDWQDHKELYDNIFSNYKSIKIIDKTNFKIKNENYYKPNKLYVKTDFNMVLKTSEIKKITLDINLTKYKDFNNDDIVGYVNVLLNKVIYHKEPIYIKKEVKKESVWRKLKGWINW